MSFRVCVCEDRRIEARECRAQGEHAIAITRVLKFSEHF